MTNNPPDKIDTRLVILLTSAMKRDLEDRAHIERRPMGEILRDLIAEYLSRPL